MPTGQPHAVRDLGNGADGGVLLLMSRNKEDELFLGAGVDGEGDGHAGENNGVIKWDKKEAAHVQTSLSGDLQNVSKGYHGKELADAGI